MKSFIICSIIAAALQGGEMITVRKSEERGHAEHGWLSTDYTFSFSDYYDSKFMGFRTLRVINQDIVDPKKGFDTHPHKDMEILTYILDGTLEHKDTMGNHSQIQKGEFQLMSAGTGVEHSEFNPSKDKKVHLLQIWIYPEKKGVTPQYQQKKFPKTKPLQLVVSPDGGEESLIIHQDAKVYLGNLAKGEKIEADLRKERHGWIQMIEGKVEVNGVVLNRGDGASLSDQNRVAIQGIDPSEFLLFDLK